MRHGSFSTLAEYEELVARYDTLPLERAMSRARMSGAAPAGHVTTETCRRIARAAKRAEREQAARDAEVNAWLLAHGASELVGTER